MDTDTAGASATDSATTVIATASAAVPTLTTLVSFNGTNGQWPEDGVTIDAAGDLFGTTITGGAYGDGTVFEIARTAGGYASTPTTLFSFNGTDGSSPYAALLMDAAGDLFGTTYLGGPNGEGVGLSGDGTAYELVNNGGGSYSQTTLVNFGAVVNIDGLPNVSGNNGLLPLAGLIADANGDLFETTTGGGTYIDDGVVYSAGGTVFELVNNGGGSYTQATLATFNSLNGDGQGLEGHLITDASGDLFGTTVGGGVNNDGTVFEIAKTSTGYASAPTTLVTFNGANGVSPVSSLITDAAGNLFGTTTAGGANDDGSVFELVNTGGSYTLITLVSFNGNGLNGDGWGPEGPLIADAAGYLFGTTSNGGANGLGTVFELSNTGFQVGRTLVWSGASGTDFANPLNWDDTTSGLNPSALAPTAIDTVEFNGGGAVTGSGTVATVSFGGDGAWHLGSAADLTVLAGMTVGTSQPNVVLIDQGTSLIETGAATIANTSGASGSSVNVSGAGSNWNVASSLIVGSGGFGALSLSQGATVDVGTLDEGSTSGGGGSVSLSGISTALDVTGNLTVGDTASGELTVVGGASVSAATISLGRNGGASGVASIAGNSLVTTGSVVVGVSGAGELSILNGANVTIGGDLDVAQLAGASGNVDIENTTGTLIIGGNLNVGLGGGVATMTIGLNTAVQLDNGGITEGKYAKIIEHTAFDP